MTTDDQARIAELERQVAQLSEQCIAARAELEAFSYAISHDLRAPLRSLSGFSQALVELPGDALDPKAQHYLSRIQQAGRKMSELIEALIGLSRVARAEMQLRTLDFSQLCEEAASAMMRLHPERKITMTIEPNMTVHGDSRLLRTALDVLLDNARKFTAARSIATIEIGQQGDTFFVRDNGIGFDMTYADKLFQPFQRLHSDTQLAGTGIGLATAQRVAARHGGRIWAQAQPQQGATIFLSLPRPVQPAAEPAA